MHLRRVLSATVILALLVPARASADVTLTQTIATSGGGHRTGQRTVISVKGLAMRVESTMGDERSATIYDVAAGRILRLDPKKREAESYDAAEVTASVEQRLPSERVTAELTATGQSKELLGVSCEAYAFTIKAPIGRDSKILFALTGTVWMAKSGEGVDDYLAFSRAADRSRLVIGDFRAKSATLVLVRGYTELLRRVAALGAVPYAIDMAFKFDGTGKMVALGNKMASGTRVTTTTAVSVAPVSGELLTVPAGWKVKTPK